jgi:uncharacterized protein (DUF433 family)
MKLRTIGTSTIDTIPFAMSADGVIRVSGTRVTLETLVAAFREGASPEEIAQQYPSLPLGDIYEVIGYCLRHPEEIEPYLAASAAKAAENRAAVEARSNPVGIRERLLARLAS